MKMLNETAIITGSTSGIGKKIAELFLNEGCKVAICSRNENNVSQTLEEFKSNFGDSVIGAPCDVSDPKSLKQLVDRTIETFGSVRILVANAGTNLSYGPFSYLSSEQVNSDANTTIKTNLIGIINSVAAVLPQMIKQNYGRIVTLSGGGADRPVRHMTIYSASKGGVVAFSKSLALEFKTDNPSIKINIFNPGMIDTNLSNNANVIEAWKDKATHDKEMEILRKHVMTDIDKSCSAVVPYVLPSCKKNGASFRGFSISKLIKGFRKVSKELKILERETNEGIK